jgi:glucan phosphoethanolaminetransferase (alkaline phosphatase superfamily)
LNAAKSAYVFDSWYDETMIPIMDSLLLRNHDARQLVVLHSIGSHWYYNLHVPPKWQIFQPLTTNRIITNNEKEQVINSYDNTVVYLDVLLDSLIASLEHRNAVLLYISDHGEALGDNGEWLHAGYAEPLHNPACVIWYSDRYAQLFPEKIQALQANRYKRYRTDFFYHSVLSAVGIKAEGNYSALDIFSLE